jgi:KaiC/GvpD/RAD55 family RecA-like ATPase
MRGTAINREKHTCSITNKGMALYPKQKISMDLPASEKRIPSEIVNLDEKIEANGLIEGTFSAIIGASGSGKSTFAFQFIAEGAKNIMNPEYFAHLKIL